MAKPPGQSTVSPNSGSTFSVVHGDRSMRGFPVTEDELETISNFNTQTQIFVGLGSFFGSQSMGAILSGMLADTLKPEGRLLVIYGPWVFGIVGTAFLFLAWHAQHMRSTMIKRIKEQTKHRQPVT